MGKKIYTWTLQSVLFSKCFLHMTPILNPLHQDSRKFSSYQSGCLVWTVQMIALYHESRESSFFVVYKQSITLNTEEDALSSVRIEEKGGIEWKISNNPFQIDTLINCMMHLYVKWFSPKAAQQICYNRIFMMHSSCSCF